MHDMEYDLLATFYDSFIDEVVYQEYLDLVNKYSSLGSMLDIGCGTGRLAIEFAKRGYDVVATDLSEEMLNIVDYRAKEEEVDLEIALYDLLDPIDFEFDIVIASMDVINHLADLEDVEFGFTNIYNSITNNGIFIFDVLSVEFIDAFDGYTEDDEEYNFHWESHKGDKEHSIVHTITIKDDENSEEVKIYEQTHDLKAYEEILGIVGFTILETITLPERTIYVVQKSESPE
ncbi:MAG: class I SAM-dependent methyltransferase [Candidatus Izemoplasmatales bacterium]|jgi:2-polyprenyl-3-methyl-5-hydroxy-6-metoxy-1,4-benzoquinol methylase|nr:class I SAM-dependent methyltransferase [Candidatus Izemoplasmatales bacterium]